MVGHQGMDADVVDFDVVRHSKSGKANLKQLDRWRATPNVINVQSTLYWCSEDWYMVVDSCKMLR